MVSNETAPMFQTIYCEIIREKYQGKSARKPPYLAIIREKVPEKQSISGKI
jgi:hypothetical protein